MKMSCCKLVSARRSTVLILPHQWAFPGLAIVFLLFQLIFWLVALKNDDGEPLGWTGVPLGLRGLEVELKYLIIICSKIHLVLGNQRSSFALLGNCDICVKWKISVINEMKQDEISLKPKVLDLENLCWILWTFAKVMDKSCPTFGHFSVHEWKLKKLSQYLTVFSRSF